MGNVGGIRSGSDFYDNLGDTTAAAASGQSVDLGSDFLRSKAGVLGDVAGGSGEIAFGARGDGAKAVQGALVQMGYLKAGSDDGIYGRGTQSAVAEFQRHNGLNASGNVDAATLAAMDQKLQLGAKKPVAGAPIDKSLVFLGVGDGAKNEAQHFAAATKTTAITDTKENDKISMKVGGQTKTYDLTTKEGCDSYVKDVGLSGNKAAEVSKIIHEAGDDARDETAQLAKVMAEADRGTRQIERFVISGHSVGGGVWGDHNGYVELDTIAKMAEAFPSAARQVEDFLYAGCYSGGESNMDRLRGIFPNLKTAFAYTGSAPGTWSGALEHNKKWEAATRGSDPSKVDRDIVRGLRKAENVAAWNEVDGYDSGQARRPLSELRTEYESNRPGFADFLSGNRTVENTQEGPVRDFYNTVQRLLQHPELPAAERPALEAARDQVIRLNFYGVVREKFHAAHGPAIRAGFQALGMTAPDFSKLSRKDAMAQVAEFERKLGAASPKPAAAEALKPLLTDGLRDLKPSQIPATWV